MTPPTHPTTTPNRSSWATVTRTSLIAATIIAVLLLAFTWPAHTAEPRSVPLGVAGTGPAATNIESALQAKEDAFDVRTFDTRTDAEAAVRRREIYGAVVAPASPKEAPEVLYASAAGTAQAGLMRGVADTLTQQLLASGAPAGTVVQATDLVPLSADDPRGATLNVAVFPLALGGILGGALVSFTVVGRLRRLAAVSGYALIGGLAIAVTMAVGYGAVGGNFGAVWATSSLALGGMAAFIVGLTAFIGTKGVAVGAALTLLLGNPLSGQQVPAEFLPWGLGRVGELFIPGAGGTLLRSITYFPDASTTLPWLVLLGWSAIGVALILTPRPLPK